MQLQGAMANLQSAGSSTDVSKSASSTTSLSEDIQGNLHQIVNPARHFSTPSSAW